MIQAVFEKKNGRFCGFSIMGHAEYADPGMDVVCAAVSSAIQYATVLVTESFEEKEQEKNDGSRITVRLENPETGNAYRILDGLWQHLSFISEDYPGTISIKILEV